MAVRSGAGASIASGADYQARIAAYLIAMDLARFGDGLTDGARIETIGFETAEAVDDLNVSVEGRALLYIQAKATIAYSLKTGGDLHAVFSQFERQHHAAPERDERFLLVTGPSASRTVTQTLRVALEAFRSSPEFAFRRDQPRSVVKVIDELAALINNLRNEKSRAGDSGAAYTILRKSEVVCLDLEPGSTLDRAVTHVLGAAGYGVPSAMWGKLITDCLSHAKSRHTVRMADIETRYERFRIPSAAGKTTITDDFLKASFAEATISVGREVSLVRFPKTDFPLAGLVILELYRFDTNCNERVFFEGSVCRLQNGFEGELLRRAATFEGLMRIIDHDCSLVGEESVTIAGINSDENFELGPCANLHRKRISDAFAANKTPLLCLHCGEGVFSQTAQVVEIGRDKTLAVGLSHLECLKSDDRVLGSIAHDLFEKYPELVNFDVNGWARSARAGNGGFGGLELVGAHNAVMTWAGHRPETHNGPYLVEAILEDGESRFVTHRNSVSRFTASHADAFVAQIKNTVAECTADPWCYSSDSWAFGQQSILMQTLGGSERILKMLDARKVKYDARVAEAYASPGHWFAPLCYLRSIQSGEPISIMGMVPLLRDPWVLKNYLDSWRRAGALISEYEVASLLDDHAVDIFLLRSFEVGLSPMIDPLLHTGDEIELAAGVPIIPAPDLEY
ncbi:MAG: hypothetical protein ACLQIQ_06840 [Beijerinckiaceae bacterium]